MGQIEYMDDPDHPVVLMKNDEVVAIHDDGIRKWVERKKWKELRAWATREKSFAHYVGVRTRPGVLAFTNDLETRYFWPPGSPRNDLFVLHEGFWEGMLWIVVSIPKRLARFAERCASKNCLAIKESIPVVFTSDSGMPPEVIGDFEAMQKYAKWFPLKLPNVHTLEYGNSSIPNAIAGLGMDVVRAAEEEYVEQNIANVLRSPRSN